jgi:fermentation-respiration switch protein FrsA (DUF1100 family)
MKIEKVAFKSEGQNISGILHLPEKQKPLCVIASHGLLSSKDSEKYIALGEKFSQEGMAMLRFDFRGIGESEGRMEDDTVSRRVIDLGTAIAFVRSHPALGKKIGFIGSSLGGYISLIRASMDQQIKGIVTWATPFHLDDLKSNKGTEGHPLPEQPFFEDLPKHRLLPLLPRVANCMVIHGERDELVPVDQAWEIFQNLSPPKEIHIIEGADHRLTQTAHRERAIQLTVDWFKKTK